MAAFNKVNQFAEDLGKAVHNFGAHQLKIALTNTAPVAGNATYAALTSPLPTTNLSGATPFNVTTTSYTQTSGTASLVLVDLTLTATGAVGPFRYVVLYNGVVVVVDIRGVEPRLKTSVQYQGMR